MNIVFPDYNRCLVNLTSSFLKHFGVKPDHKTLGEIDELLSEKTIKTSS